MATGTDQAPAYNVEASSTEVMELIPGKIKATHIRDIYIKSDTEQNFFCNVIHLTYLDNNRIVVVDDAVSKHDQFGFSQQEAGRFRMKLVDTGRNHVVSVLDVRGQFTSMVKLNDTQIAVCVNRRDIVLVRVDNALTAERRLKFPGASDKTSHEITHLSTYKGDLYFCDRKVISKIDMMGQTTEVFKSIRSELDGFRHFTSCAMYTNADKTSMYVITKNCHPGDYGYIIQNPYLSHWNGGVDELVKGKIDMPGEPGSVAIDDERELLFILLYKSSGDKDFYGIYVLQPGTTDGCVLLDKADGLQDVTSMAYCSRTRQLFVGSEENNYVKVYQLSSVP